MTQIDCSKLLKREIIHLIESNITTIEALKDTRAYHKRMDKDRETCWDCRSIAKKLGLES